MNRNSAKRILTLAFTLATIGLWIGCDQKGDISPTGTGRPPISIDTVIVEPGVVAPGGTASVEARILNESLDPAVGEKVRFKVSRGAICVMHSDTTMPSDSLGWVRATFTASSAAEDTGEVELRTELLSMAEVLFTTITVSSVPGGACLSTPSPYVNALPAEKGSFVVTAFPRVRNSETNSK